jgi:hypothetical protein
MYQVLLILSTQILGYSLAGITRRYLVRPSSMIWPSTLVSTAMFTALHKDENKPADGWTIAPRKFFVRIFIGSVAFYFLPGLLFPALSYFNVITWFAPKNVVIANLVCPTLRNVTKHVLMHHSLESHLVLDCFPLLSIGHRLRTLDPR